MRPAGLGLEGAIAVGGGPIDGAVRGRSATRALIWEVLGHPVEVGGRLEPVLHVYRNTGELRGGLRVYQYTEVWTGPARGRIPS